MLVLILLSLSELLTLVGSSGGGYMSVYSPAALEEVSTEPFVVLVTVTTLLCASET